MKNTKMTMTLEFYARTTKSIPSVAFYGEGLAKTGKDEDFDEFSLACHKYCASLIKDGAISNKPKQVKRTTLPK